MRHAWWPPLWAALTIGPCLAQGAELPDPSHAPGELPLAGEPLTLSRAVDLALQVRPELAAARSEVAAADAALAQAGVLSNPTLQAEVEDTHRQTRSTTVWVTQPIEWGGKRAARQDAARLARDAALARLAAQRQTLRSEVCAAFFAALVARERHRLAEESAAVARRATEAAHQRVQAGKVSPIDETKARVAESGVRIEAMQAQTESRVAMQALQAAMGSTARVHSLAGQVEPPVVPSDGQLHARLASAAAVLQAQLEVEHLGALARLERAKKVPDMTVGIGAKRSEELGRPQMLVSLSIPLQIFDTNRHAEVQALRRQDTARHEVHATVLRLRKEVMAAQGRLQAFVAEAQALQQDILPGALAAYETSTKGFELGKFGFLDVLDSQRTLLQARTQWLKALAEAHRAAADINRLLSSAEPMADTAPVGDTPS